MSDSQILKNVLFIGAGGNIGGPIFRSLENAGFDLTVLSRPNSTNKFGPNVKVVKKEYDDPSLHEVFEGQDAVVSFVSVTALLDQLKLIDIAVKAGVKRFIPSELGSNTLNPKAQELVLFYKQKRTVLNHLEAAAKQNPSFSWTGLATGPVFDWISTSGSISSHGHQGLKNSFLGFDLKAHTALIYDDGDIRSSYSNLATIGETVVAVLREPVQTANMYLYISSFTVSQNEILASLEKATATKWTVNKGSTVDREREGKVKLANGDFSGVLLLLARLMYGGDAGTNFEEERTLANKLLGLPQESLDATVQSVVDGQNREIG
ncbi:hypothetical protein LTR72_010940 [Exophiala xenobiotica]|nr:hypothetical protein LTR72_010940 [Exophiala xenobiotica]KAK5279712.1 hypothetical protein LTR40_007398 [Exophiala xenobiotica]KAK5285483.1 hypothetical protein LTR14_010879 [Exophiala xenobiotica]KAK5367086.1 hypothetical protein LTS13_007939 [Exophiala xenobiotica]KAK5401385.1 hypothetical protein LTR79_001904 [Exophiala xenobiotica]